MMPFSKYLEASIEDLIVTNSIPFQMYINILHLRHQREDPRQKMEI